MTAPVTTHLADAVFGRGGPKITHFICAAVGPDDPTHSICGAHMLGIPPEGTFCPTCRHMGAPIVPRPLYCTDHTP